MRGAYEFQGQKCSAASRAYVPKSLWPKLKERVVALIDDIRMGDSADFRNFMGAVIDERAWKRLDGWLQRLRHDQDVTVLRDKGWSRELGWFAGPTLVEVRDPKNAVLAEELFGPILAVHVYADADVDAALRLVDETSPYALTGAIFARDRTAVAHAAGVLRQAAGNLYINDKPTGAVVGQQPFGGGRASGTNDKAGASYNLIRWASPRVDQGDLRAAHERGVPVHDGRGLQPYAAIFFSVPITSLSKCTSTCGNAITTPSFLNAAQIASRIADRVSRWFHGSCVHTLTS